MICSPLTNHDVLPNLVQCLLNICYQSKSLVQQGFVHRKASYFICPQTGHKGFELRIWEKEKHRSIEVSMRHSIVVGLLMSPFQRRVARRNFTITGPRLSSSLYLESLLSFSTESTIYPLHVFSFFPEKHTLNCILRCAQNCFLQFKYRGAFVLVWRNICTPFSEWH